MSTATEALALLHAEIQPRIDAARATEQVASDDVQTLLADVTHEPSVAEALAELHRWQVLVTERTAAALAARDIALAQERFLAARHALTEIERERARRERAIEEYIDATERKRADDAILAAPPAEVAAVSVAVADEIKRG